MLAEQYGNETVIEKINERRYTYGSYGNELHTPGATSKFNGAKGFVGSIPSFLLCALISPPLAGIMLLGALALRLESKWTNKKSLISALNPFTWAEYIASGNYIPDGSSKPFFMKDKGDNLKNTESNVIKDAHGNIINDLNQTVTMEDIEKTQHRWYWLPFDNGEVRKVLAFDKKSANTYAQGFMHPSNTKLYDEMNMRLEHNGRYDTEPVSVYVCEFEDGQVFYVIGSDEDKARTNANILMQAYKKDFENAGIKYDIPAIKKITEVNDTKISKPTQCSDPMLVPPAHKEIPENKKRKERKYWEFKNLMHYKFSISLGPDGTVLIYNFPMQNMQNAQSMQNSVKNNLDRLLDLLKRESPENLRDVVWYTATFKDGDKYFMPVAKTTNPDNIVKLAKDLYDFKLAALAGSLRDGNSHSIVINRVQSDRILEDVKIKRLDENQAVRYNQLQILNKGPKVSNVTECNSRFTER